MMCGLIIFAWKRVVGIGKGLRVCMRGRFQNCLLLRRSGTGSGTYTRVEYRRKCLQRARAVFERALSYLRTSAPELKEERAMLFEEWLNIESNFGEVGDVDSARAKLPKKLKKRRHIESEDCPAGFAKYLSFGYDEYIDHLFPEETQTTNLKILDVAYKWKRQKRISSVLAI